MSGKQLKLFDSPKEVMIKDGLMCPHCQERLVEDWSLNNPGIWKGARCYGCGWDVKPLSHTEVNS